jgi:outer membrane protein OmpA-like peptidoglycan-associated protein
MFFVVENITNVRERERKEENNETMDLSTRPDDSVADLYATYHFRVMDRALHVPDGLTRPGSRRQAEQSPGAKYCGEDYERKGWVKGRRTYWACNSIKRSGCWQEARRMAAEAENWTSVSLLPPAPAPEAKVVVFEEVALFDLNKAVLKPEGKEQIKAYREEAREELSRADKIKISGHTDNTGSADYNMNLSLRRAEAVRDYLVSIGVDPTKIEVIGGND